MWILLGFISMISLGIYDVLKKIAVDKNAVLPVLFLSTIPSAIIFLPFLIASILNPDLESYEHFYIPPQGIIFHLHLIAKTAIVIASWIFAYLALKNLPITIVSPIRSTGPVWTLIGAIIIYGESLSMLQWTGMGVALFFFYFLSRAGSKEGIDFRNNKWIWFIILATFIGTLSTLYDKYLIANFNRIAVQAYFSFYQVPMMLLVVAFFWWPKRKKLTPFKWSNAIPFIGIVLMLGDFAYFYSLTYEDSLISILSLLRRSSVIITFVVGALLFKEKNAKHKGLIVLGIMLGLYLIMLGS